MFSGSTYRADLLIRNHIQVEKTTNLVSSCNEIPAVEHTLMIALAFYYLLLPYLLVRPYPDSQEYIEMCKLC